MDVGGEICKWAWWRWANGIFNGLEISIFPQILCVTCFSFYPAYIKSIYFSSIYNWNGVDLVTVSGERLDRPPTFNPFVLHFFWGSKLFS
jgi:hypothetical protein